MQLFGIRKYLSFSPPSGSVRFRPWHASPWWVFAAEFALIDIHREVMREVEDRLTAAIDRLGDRLDRFVEAAVHK
jgi:hypothetical protein